MSFSCEKFLNTIVCYRKLCHLRGMPPGPPGSAPDMSLSSWLGLKSPVLDVLVFRYGCASNVEKLANRLLKRLLFCCIFEDSQQKFGRNLVIRFITIKVEITVKKCE